ncbi:MAG: SDR family NAD(P)-dependent oxidoreductase [Firmicutes bacterium]|nr:SDR family NAD(P)-dependent oxidoreductase [Bacillota bacterium]
MRIPLMLITGAAGFIGYHLAARLLEEGHRVVGLDNMNDYYEVRLKEWRISKLMEYADTFTFIKADLTDAQALDAVFSRYKPEIVVNLAAQAGVRYSIENPRAYIQSNVIGFFNILEACRSHPVSHLVYASSSSVYGNQQKTPFSISDSVDQPISLYAATKKSNELMAYTYAHLYGISNTGLRFFTVYGPAGRPDMAYYSFTRKILSGETMQVFNHGDLYRDFTYIDDIIAGICNILPSPPQGENPARLYNIGNNQPQNLLQFIQALEQALSCVYGRELRAEMEFLPMQDGDVYQTYADVDDLVRDFGFKPSTPMKEGLLRFAQWYQSYHVE